MRCWAQKPGAFLLLQQPSPLRGRQSADPARRLLKASALVLAGGGGQLRGGGEENGSFSEGALCFSVGGNSREKGRGTSVARRLLCVEGFSANQSGASFFNRGKVSKLKEHFHQLLL